MRGFGISSIAYILDAVVSGVLVWMAAVSFKQANSSAPDQQLPHTFQGIMQASTVLQLMTACHLTTAPKPARHNRLGGNAYDSCACCLQLQLTSARGSFLLGASAGTL